MSATEVRIEYCVPCGFLSAAEQTAHAVMGRYDKRLGGLTLVPGRGGVFRVQVAGQVVFDKAAGEGFDLDAIVERVGEQLSSTSVGGQ
jgi:selenoprotein W-related protein